MRNETKEVDFKHCCFNELSVLHDWSALSLRETRAKTKLVDLTKIPYGNGNQANLGLWFQPIAAWRQRETAIRQFGAEQCTKPLPFPFVEWICVLNLCLMARLKRLTFAWVLVVAFASCRNTFLGHATRHDQCEPPQTGFQLSNEHH